MRSHVCTHPKTRRLDPSPRALGKGRSGWRIQRLGFAMSAPVISCMRWLRCNSLILFDCFTSAGICGPHLIHVHCWPIRNSSLAASKIWFLCYWVTELHGRYSIYKCMILAGSDEYISVTLRPQSFFVRLAGGVLMFKTLGLQSLAIGRNPREHHKRETKNRQAYLLMPRGYNMTLHAAWDI